MVGGQASKGEWESKAVLCKSSDGPSILNFVIMFPSFFIVVGNLLQAPQMLLGLLPCLQLDQLEVNQLLASVKSA
jgi:hypothetical protein